MRSKSNFILNLLISVIFAISLCSQNCAHKSKFEYKVFKLNYFYSTEVIYEKIFIENRNLVYTFFEGTDKRCQNWVKQQPCWGQADLKRREYKLSVMELKDLIDLIEMLHFMELESVYGNAKENQSYYTYVLSIVFDSKEKTVIYQDFPSAEPMPDAFRKIKDKIFDLIPKK